MKFKAYISGVQFIFEGPEDVPKSIRKAMGKAAGKKHSKKGPVMAALVDALNEWERIRRGGEGWDDQMGMPGEVIPDGVQGQLDI